MPEIECTCEDVRLGETDRKQCNHDDLCGAVECRKHGIILEPRNDRQGYLCSVCRADRIQDETTLSSQQAYTYALNSQDGYTESEISDIMNLEVGTVRSHLQRARDKIKKAERTVELL